MRSLKGCDFAAWLGLVPKQISTGDRTILGKIPKRGNRYLRVLFVQAAWVLGAERKPSNPTPAALPRSSQPGLSISGRVVWRSSRQLDQNQEHRHLAEADRHIAQATGYVTRQRLIIDQLAAMGQPTDEAWSTLSAFEGRLKAFERHRAMILGILRND
jgi:hypothetical protein